MIDDFPRLVDLVFIRAFSEALPSALLIKLGANETNPAARAARYFEEDEYLKMKRTSLEDDKRRLEQAIEALTNFNQHL